jgi:putative FmdB family regulatory protein
MPLFDFECDKCKITFEDVTLVTMWEVQCPECGSTEVRKLMGAIRKPPPAIESSDRYQKWFHSEDTQAKLRSGEYSIMPKSHNINHA